jgi:hypothetical protein
MSIPDVKPMMDRAKEAVTLIKQIRDLGISETDPSYLEVKSHLNEWIKSEDRIVKNYDIYFARYARKSTLTLPWKASKTCEFSMKKASAS